MQILSLSVFGHCQLLIAAPDDVPEPHYLCAPILENPARMTRSAVPHGHQAQTPKQEINIGPEAIEISRGLILAGLARSDFGSPTRKSEARIRNTITATDITELA
jgi:hypothetical protein